MQPLPPASRSASITSSSSSDEDLPPGDAWKGQGISFHGEITGDNRLTPEDRAGLANDALRRLIAAAHREPDVAVPTATAAAAAPSGLQHAFALGGGAVAGGFGGTLLMFVIALAAGPEFGAIAMSAAVPLGAAVGMAIAELAIHGYCC